MCHDREKYSNNHDQQVIVLSILQRVLEERSSDIVPHFKGTVDEGR